MDDNWSIFDNLKPIDLVTLAAMAIFLVGLLLVALSGRRRSSPVPLIGGATLCVFGFGALILAGILG
jgi:hypothetical protein